MCKISRYLQFKNTPSLSSLFILTSGRNFHSPRHLFHLETHSPMVIHAGGLRCRTGRRLGGNKPASPGFLCIGVLYTCGWVSSGSSSKSSGSGFFRSSGLSSAISKSSSISMSGSWPGSPTTGAGRLVNGRSWFLWSVRRRPWPSSLFTLNTGMTGKSWSSTIYGYSCHLSVILCFPLMPSFSTSTLSPTTSLFSWTFRS